MKSADFKKIVTKELAPFLRQNKWKGTGFDYTSHIEKIVNLFTIQPSSSGGKFCIEVGVHFDFLPLKSDKEFSKLKTWNVGIRKRLSPNEGTDYWWPFLSTDSEKTVLFEELA